MNHYVLDICSDMVNSDDAVDVLMRWVGHEDERVALLEDLLHKVQLNKCSDKGIKTVIKTHEALLDKTPMVYKLLLKTSADVMTDSIAVVGGRHDNEANKICWNINQSDEMVQLCDIPVDKLGINFSVCMTAQGFVATGGLESNICIMYITLTRSWFRLQDMLMMRQSHGTICVKQVLYVFGGFVGNYHEDSKPSNSVDSIAMESGNWEEGPGLPMDVALPNVSNLDDRVYLLDQESSQLLCLDINKELWHALAPLPGEGSSNGVTMASARGQLFVAGGKSMFCSWYRPETDTWCTGQCPKRYHSYGALVHHNNKLLLLGGYYKEGTDEVEEYNIENDEWSLCSYRMPKKLCLHHAVVLSM